MPGLEKAFAALKGRFTDEEALKALQGQLAQIEHLEGRVRGSRFEVWLSDLLAAHGCQGRCPRGR